MGRVAVTGAPVGSLVPKVGPAGLGRDCRCARSRESSGAAQAARVLVGNLWVTANLESAGGPRAGLAKRAIPTVQEGWTSSSRGVGGRLAGRRFTLLSA